MSTLESTALTNGSHDLSFVSPSNHEEADTRMFLHAKDASNSGLRKVSIRTVDTDVVIIALGMFSKMELNELWISFGTGKNFRVIPIHSLVESLGEIKCSCMPLFHAFTGCDQVSFFGGRGKKGAWNTWNQFDELTASLHSLSDSPSLDIAANCFPTLERFVVLLYDRTNTTNSVNELRKILFSRKGRSLEGIPHQLTHCFNIQSAQFFKVPIAGDNPFVKRKCYLIQMNGAGNSMRMFTVLNG